jgi:uncharacterized protein YjiS (DUF1127 family)
MIPPTNCPYRALAAQPCWSCPHYIADTDQCTLACIETRTTTDTSAMNGARTYAERLRDYEKRRQELLQLSKEALVDLIIHRPKYY